MDVITRAEAKEQGLKRYFTGKECKHGHVSERSVAAGLCLDCRSITLNNYNANNKDKIIKSKKRYYESVKECLLRKDKVRVAAALRYKNNPKKYQSKSREYAQHNKEKTQQRWQVFYKKNRKEILAKAKAYANNNKSKISKKKKEYRESNAESISEYQKAYHKKNRVNLSKKAKEKSRLNPLPRFIRATIRRIELATGNKRVIRTQNQLNYTQHEFINHIESQFINGMSWDSRSEWHIDHIKPIKAFLDEGVTDVKIINALSNLQPLWAKDNLSKGAKYNENN